MKKILALFLVLLTVFAVFAQGANEAKSEKPVINFYHGYFHDAATWQPAVDMRAIYDEFAKLHEDEFTFNAIALDSGQQGVYDKCIQELALGRFPDMVDVAGMTIIPAATAAGFALDFRPYIDADPEFKNGIGINYQQNMLDGKIHTVRDQLETIGFWYNEELFNKAGAKTPDKWTTWQDFVEAVAKLNACKDVETPFTMNQGWPTTLIFSGYLLGSEEGRKFASSPVTDFDNKAFKDALQFIATEVLGKITNEHFTAEDSERYRTDFFEGKAAMLFNGVWESGSFASIENPERFKSAVFPTLEKGKTAAIVSASPGIVANAKMSPEKIAACVELAKFMTSKMTAIVNVIDWFSLV